MPQPWPAELPQRFDKDGYQDAFADNRLASKTDIGPALIRSRISSMPRRISGVMKMNKTQLDRLRKFWQVDTLDGKLPFIFPDPVFGTGSFKNYIPNSSYAGAAAGSPGSLPTGWSGLGVQNGITKRVEEIGVEGGLEYVDIVFSGVPAGATTAEIIFSPDIPYVSGETWTHSAYVRMKSGTKTNIERTALFMYAVPTTQASFNNFLGGLSTAPLELQRFEHTWKPDVVGMTAISPRLHVRGVQTGQPINIVLRVAGVQLEKLDRASDFILTPNTGFPITRFAAGGNPPSPIFLGGKTWGVNLELEIFET